MRLFWKPYRAVAVVLKNFFKLLNPIPITKQGSCNTQRITKDLLNNFSQIMNSCSCQNDSKLSIITWDFVLKVILWFHITYSLDFFLWIREINIFLNTVTDKYRRNPYDYFVHTLKFSSESLYLSLYDRRLIGINCINLQMFTS